MEIRERERRNEINRKANNLSVVQHLVIAVLSTIYATMIGYISHNILCIVAASIAVQLMLRVLMIGDSRKDQDVFWLSISMILIILLVSILL